MKAAVVERWGEPDVISIKEIATPSAKPGWVLIKVMAFGLNRAELYTRQGHSPGANPPLVLGIECVGIVQEAPGSSLEQGQKVVAIMGGMGRMFNGSYAEFTCVPETCVFPVESSLDWSTLGAIPEMFQTVWGSLNTGLEIESGQSLLIRGGTSSIGMAATQMAKRFGLTVIATTRNPDKRTALSANGVDHVVIDQGEIANAVTHLFPDGVDKVLELVGTTTILDSLRCAKRMGTVCMTGMLGNEWILREFEPMEAIPVGVRFTIYGGDAEDMDSIELQRFINDVTQGHISLNIDRVFQFDEIVNAHRYMEQNRASGKLVVVTNNAGQN